MQQCLQISFILNLKARRTHRPSKQSAQEQERERENIITLKKKKKIPYYSVWGICFYNETNKQTCIIQPARRSALIVNELKKKKWRLIIIVKEKWRSTTLTPKQPYLPSFVRSNSGGEIFQDVVCVMCVYCTTTASAKEKVPLPHFLWQEPTLGLQ